MDGPREDTHASAGFSNQMLKAKLEWPISPNTF